MVRQYIGKYIESYFAQEMSMTSHIILLSSIALLIGLLYALLFSIQLGIILLLHFIIFSITTSWILFYIAAALISSFFLYTLLHGIYEIKLFVLYTLWSSFPLHTKLLMIIVFLLDFLLSDVIMVLGGFIIATIYFLVATSQSLNPLTFLPYALLFGILGSFFQALFVSSYNNTKYFSRIVSASKKIVFSSDAPILFGGKNK